MSQLSLNNVVNISVSAAQTGAGGYNTSNIGLFTSDPFQMSFGSAGYAIYLDPTQVGIDFGTTSETYKMANSIFSQKPNILAGGGYLAVIPFLEAIQTVSFSATGDSGGYTVNYGAANHNVTWSDSFSGIQDFFTGLPGLSNVIVTGTSNGTFSVDFVGLYGAATAITITNNTMTHMSSPVTPTVTQTRIGETLAPAITRTAGLVQYFGILSNQVLGSTDGLAAAAVAQALNKIQFLGSRTEADIEPSGYLDELATGNLTQSRGLYYNGTSTDAGVLLMVSAYAGRALSVNFSGSNTTSTMHLKDLIGVQPDLSITQTLLGKAQAAGADLYVSLQGVAKVFTSGANNYFDQVYNLQWLVGALQIAGFNYLAESSTKIPQTESGMSGLKGAYRAICQQAVTNQYLAPGSWNSSTTFGNQIDFLLNVGQTGYYIYSQPVSQQSQANRAARQAPLVQIAVKEAGAIQESDVVIYVNA